MPLRQQAVLHFQQTDPVMAALAASAIQTERPPRVLEPVSHELYFAELAESIVSQQLSVKAADTIWSRFVEFVGKVEPASILDKTQDELRSVGLSNAKANYILLMSEMLMAGKLELSDLDELEDEAVIERLTLIKGIGRWSAEMFLMFTLARPDIFSAGDLGLVRAVESAYDRPDISFAELTELAGTWSPYRTFAAQVLWHSRDNAPKTM